MIYIKDKGKRTPIYIPRNGEGTVEYATDLDIQELEIKINDISKSLNNVYTKKECNEMFTTFKSVCDEDYQPKGNYLTTIPSEYATEEYVAMQINNTLGTLNNELEEILN